MTTIQPVPPTLKPCQTYMKLATDHEKVNPIITYWCRLYALQLGLKIDSKAPENRVFLMSVMDWLEKEKKIREADDNYINEIVAQAHVENYGMKIFLKADEVDRAGNATKNTAKQFFTAAQIFDMCAVFGEVGEDLLQKSKYGKWRAAYIIKCIKNNETPLPPEDEKSNDDLSDLNLPPAQQTSNNEQSTFNPDLLPDIGKPPAPFNSEDFSLDHLRIDNPPPSKPPSSASSTISRTDYSNQPPTASNTASKNDFSSVAMNGVQLSRDCILKAQKYSKWASSALDYDDIGTAVNNLQKALNILTRGSEN